MLNLFLACSGNIALMIFGENMPYSLSLMSLINSFSLVKCSSRGGLNFV